MKTWVDENLYKDALSALQRVIRIPSVEGEAKEDMPFGEGPTKALQEFLKIGEELGFKVYNHKNMAGHIEMGEGEEYIGVLAHVDVVPEGNDWAYPPYGAEIHDDYMYGRGTVDDKGPAMSCLYAMKALKDANFPIKRKIRLILGANEETGSKGVEDYFKTFPAPFMGFTPDANFPAIFAEYGNITFSFNTKLKKDGIEILEFQGGQAHNMVADRASILLCVEKKEEMEAYLKNISCPMPWKYLWDHNNLKIDVEGVSAHGSTPDQGENAISYLMENLSKLPYASLDFAREYMEFFAFSDDGLKLDVKLEDEISGKLRMNLGVIRKEGKNELKLVVNIRYPVTFTGEKVYTLAKKRTEGALWTISSSYDDSKPLYYPKDSELIVKLMEVYQEETGLPGAEPIAVGGGTYARTTKNVVAFGPIFLGEEDVIHQKNERISLASYRKIMEIYAKALFALANV